MFFVVLRRCGPQWDPSRPLEEQSDWDAHASFMDHLVDEGFVVLGGPLADEERVVLVVEAESEDAVRALRWGAIRGADHISRSTRSSAGRSALTDDAASADRR